MKLLEVNDLSISYRIHRKIVNIVNSVSFSINDSEILGVIGESGSGKTQTALAILGLLSNNAIISGSIKFNGKELIKLSDKNFRQLRSNDIAIVFQDPNTSLNPYLSIKKQLIETLMYHKKISKAEAISKSLRMLDYVKIPNARNTIKLYPHELSGGMKQRVTIAMSLLCEPKLLIADEITTSLDVTNQSQILELLLGLKKEFNMSIMMITHDFGVVAHLCDYVNVMYSGSILESANVYDIFYNPQHPYSKGLLSSIANISDNKKKLEPILGEPSQAQEDKIGCVFSKRCVYVSQECLTKTINNVDISNNHKVKCILKYK